MKRNLMFKVLLMLMVGCFLSIDAFAQQMTVKGLVKDTTGEPIIGANVVVKGTTNGTITDFDGNFQLNANKGDIIVISFIGYQSQEVPAAPSLNILLKDDSQMLQDVVVIGYGTVKKNDATGSVTAIKAEEKNKGLTVSPQDMIAGKVAGVNVATSTGQPGGGSAIRIRGGSSLTASNDPLIVIDGVVMSSGSVEGLSNPLSSVNPTDIESFTVLKDASATAIYGSRASNGVIIITTKKGKTGSVKINYSGNVSVSTRKNKIDVMTGDEYRDFIINNPNATEAMITAVNLYPGVNTDWQDEVMRTAVSTEHNISAYGSVKAYLPYRVSFGYTNQNGILKTSNFERYTGSVSLTPKFFDDHLNMNLNAKGIYIKNQFADTGAVVGAVSFDPTKPVKNDNNKFGGYFTWTTDNDPNGTKASSAGVNPVSLLEMTDDQSKVKSFIGNAQFDYKVHFLPDLRLNLNVGMDYTKSDGDKYVDPTAPGSYGEDPLKSGSNYLYFYERRNTLLDFYAQYSKDFAKQHFDVMAGYSYQKYHYESNKETWYLSRNEENFGERTSMNGDQQPAESQYVLLSFYGRLNYTAWDKYLLTFTLRDDASSRFEVMFITTANYVDQIPNELRDRLEIIELYSYTEFEKLDIAKHHLIPLELEEHGLSNDQVEFTDDAILSIIRFYTKEAGVRDLDRLISTVLRKIVKEIIVEEKNKKYKVATKDLKKYLGNKKYINNELEENRIGVANGLAYTPFGGDVLPIEATYFKGNGNLMLTGSLGDVMKESAKIAFSYIKSNCKEFEIDEKIFDKNDFHIHVPEGAVPKDGPSAGITLTTAMLSMLKNKKLKSNMAMTGEITLTGKILPIGGLREKLIAANRSGIKLVLIPSENKNDLDEIPQNIKSGIKFILVDDYKEVYERIW